MKVAECMSSTVETVTPEQSIQEAAQLMLTSDVGALPVVKGNSLSGMITNRDIAVRAVADGLDAHTRVSEIMTDQALSVFDDQDVEDAALMMSDSQVRRLPVVSREEGRLIGVISLADVSRSDQFEATDVALDGITEPGGEHTQAEDG